MSQSGPRSLHLRRAAVSLAIALLLAAPLTAAAAPVPGSGTGADVEGLGGSAHYRQAQEHAGDVIDFEPGRLVRTPFVPRSDDAWEVDGAKPRPIPAGFATGVEMLRTPASRAWAAGIPEDVAAPWHFSGMRGASEATWAHELATPETGFLLAGASGGGDARTEATDGARVSASGLRREVFGFLPYWELNDRSTVLDWRVLSTVAYFSVGCQANGALLKRNPDGSPTTGWAGWTSSRMTSIITAAHQHQTRVVLTVSCFAWSTSGAAAQAALLGSATARATLARQVAAAVRDRGADGVNLDFEPIAAGYAEEFTKLVRQIRQELNAIARGYQLTFDAMGSVGNQPIAAATAPGGADAVLIMGYDYRTSSSNEAGSISPLTGPEYDLNDTVRAFTAQVPPSKIILGVPWYGRAWSTPTDDPHAKNISGAKYGRAAEPTYAMAYDLLRGYGRRWDPIEQSPWTAYRKQTCSPANGCVTSWRELYIDDAASLKLRYDLVNRSGLRGAGIWALGFDGPHPELRAALAAKFLTDRTPPLVGITTLAPRQRDEGFRVAWTSYDDSAIRSYDVQVSIDGGWWRSWTTGTTATSATYLGKTGHAYAFRVRATDAHGNVSAWRALPLRSLGTPARLAAGGFATVVTDGLRLRGSPSLGGSIMTTFRAGEALRIIGGPVSANGYSWYEVEGPVRQWPPVEPMQVGGWVAAFGNGVTNAVPRSPLYTTKVDAGIVALQINGGGLRLLSPNGDGADDRLLLSWTNRLSFDGLRLRVFRADGRLVGEDRLSVSKLSAGRHTLVWDGWMDGTRILPGTYVLQLQGTAGGRTYSAPSASPVSASQVARWGVVVGRVAPTTLVGFSPTPLSPTSASRVTYALTFAGPVTGLARDDLRRSGTAAGCTIGNPIGSGMRWSVAVSGCGQGTLVLSLRAGSVTDAVSNRGPDRLVSAPAVVFDRTAPRTGAPHLALATSTTLSSPASSSGVPATLSWSASDVGGAGVASYDVRSSRDGGAFVDLALGVRAPRLSVTLAPGHTYRFEVRARDAAGNVGSWTAGSTGRAVLLQQDVASVRYGGPWRETTGSRFSGGDVRWSITTGAAATFTFTGRGVGFVASRGPDRGAVNVYLDGRLVAQVNLHAAALGQRIVVWSRTWAASGTHTLKLVVVGTAGHPRVDIDAFEILR